MRIAYRPAVDDEKKVVAAFVEKKSHSAEEQMEWHMMRDEDCGGQKLMKRQAAAYRERFNERTQRRLFILLFYTARLTRSRRMMKNIGTHDIVRWHSYGYGFLCSTTN